MYVAHCIPRGTNTHSGCVIVIAFPLQQWLHEHASMLRYMYIASLVSLGLSNWLQLFSQYFIIPDTVNCFSFPLKMSWHGHDRIPESSHYQLTSRWLGLESLQFQILQMYSFHLLYFAIQFAMVHACIITSDYSLKKWVSFISASLYMSYTCFLLLQLMCSSDNSSGTHFYALACIPCSHEQSSELIQSWHHVSWVFIETVMLILFLIMASTHSVLSCVCCWPSRTFFIQQTVHAFFFKWLTNLFTLCHLKQPSPYCPSMLL
jgi:hypothetical protein